MTTDQVPTAPVDGLRSPRAAACFASYEVVFAYLFGSHARGDPRPTSDVDVAVRHPTAEAASVDVRVGLAADLAAATGLARVEVVVLDERRLPLLCRVLRERVVVYSADEVARVRFESRQRRICADFMRRAARLDRELLAGHAEGRR